MNGGAIALGHPVGASECRILVTLIYVMKEKKANTGLATLCIGDGMDVVLCKIEIMISFLDMPNKGRKDD